jgi:hypothetical protein
MISKDGTQFVIRHLFLEEDSQVYGVLDAASIPNLLTRLREQEPEFECLFMGELEPDMAGVVPYLVHLDRNADFTEWLIEEGWGRHWGIFAVAEAGMKAMRQHFRSLFTVYDPEGKPLYFRYYDPRVLRVYLPTCNPSELNAVFGPVRYYLLESEDPRAAIQFHHAAGALQDEKLLLGKQ